MKHIRILRILAAALLPALLAAAIPAAPAIAAGESISLSSAQGAIAARLGIPHVRLGVGDKLAAEQDTLPA